MDYYRFPYCWPHGGVRMEDTFFGELVAGDRIQSSPYNLHMLQDSYCHQLCISNVGRGEQKVISPNKMVRGIRKGYHHNWILDGLVSASKSEGDTTITTRYFEGFPMGFVQEGSNVAYLNNHVNLEIMYHQHSDDEYEIVRFTVEPFSIRYEFGPNYDSYEQDGQYKYNADFLNPIASCNLTKIKTHPRHTNFEMVTGKEPQLASGKVLFTYDVIWIENKNLDWAHRWDIYLNLDGFYNPTLMHSFLVFSIMVVVFLGTVLGLWVTRIMSRQRQALPSTTDHVRAMYWDVLRTPDTAPRILALCLGSGAQILSTIILTFLVRQRFFQPGHLRASIISIGLSAFALSGFSGGLCFAWISKTLLSDVPFRPEPGDMKALAAPLWLSFLVVGVYFWMNIWTWLEGSTLSIPFWRLIVHLLLFFMVSAPLTMAGSYIGFHFPKCRFPMTARTLRRPIPPQPTWLKLPCAILLAGVLPFASFVLNGGLLFYAIWEGVYDTNYMWSFVNFLCVVVQSALVSVLFMLASFQRENYVWWWRSFVVGASPAVYAMVTTFVAEGNSYGLFFPYMWLMCFGFGLVLGFASLLACLFFNILFFRRLIPLDVAGGSEEEEIGYLMIDEPTTAFTSATTVGSLLFQKEEQ